MKNIDFLCYLSLLSCFKCPATSIPSILRPDLDSTLHLMQLKIQGKQTKKMQQQGEGTNFDVDYLHKFVKLE